MDDEEMMLELHEDLEEGDVMEDGEILEEYETVDIGDWKKKSNSWRLATRKRGGENRDADLADER
jgi:hypothetical protein